MQIDFTLIAVAIISGSLATIPGVWALRNQYKKDAADASSINVDTALKLMKKLETKVDKMSARIEVLERNETEYVKYLRKLIRQIEKEGVVPVVTLEQVNNIAREVQR